MRLTDIAILASTKLRSHRVRTSITIGVSGILFGLLMSAVLIMQGVFTSIEKFSDEGLNSRYIVTVSHFDESSFGLYDRLGDAELIEQVEKAHAELVAKKQAAAKKYNVIYDPELEDPSPITIDQSTKKKVIDDTAIDTPLVQEAANKIAQEKTKPFNIKTVIDQYSSAKVLGRDGYLSASDGLLVYMKDGKETALNDQEERVHQAGLLADDNDRGLMVLPQTVTEPFVTTVFDATKGELPVIFTYSDAEKLLGLKPLAKDAKSKLRRDRAHEVHRRVNEATASFCYRNDASNMLLDQARQQTDEIEKNKQNKDYQQPSVIYRLPAASSCGAVEVVSDTRTEIEKQADQNYRDYQKAIGAYVGEPAQKKILLRGVGISADAFSPESQTSVANLAQTLLSSSLGYGAWVIPEGLLKKVPDSQKPAAIFAKESTKTPIGGYVIPTAYLVEFGDKQEALDLLRKSQAANSNSGSSLYVSPFGSASLILAELRTWADKILFWALIVVGTVAAIILSGLIGRTIADSRRETAVFRAIGASRSMITMMYLVYTLLFSCRVIIFTVVLGFVVAGIAHLLLHEEATIGAQLVFGAVDQTKTFGFIDIRSWYVVVIVGSIIVVGILATILPLLRNIGRNPIRDMRDE